MSENSATPRDENETDIHGSERLTIDNTKSVSAKVGTRASRQIYVHNNDLPLSEGDHFRYLGGFSTQKPTDHGFYPEYGLVKEIRDAGVSKIYFVNRDGSASEIEDLNPPKKETDGGQDT